MEWRYELPTDLVELAEQSKDAGPEIVEEIGGALAAMHREVSRGDMYDKAVWFVEAIDRLIQARIAEAQELRKREVAKNAERNAKENAAKERAAESSGHLFEKRNKPT